MGVGRGALAPLDFENCSKNSFFCSFEWEKTNFTTFGPPLEKFWINPFVAPLEKNPSEAHASSRVLFFNLGADFGEW